ncbi:MAG: hypothetical protein D6689_04185 [Deltaproteobacteria bacterium]|nr:MAG: hypothetical protein D6689_04185 [Deltaproteobacteria bacterium]
MGRGQRSGRRARGAGWPAAVALLALAGCEVGTALPFAPPGSPDAGSDEEQVQCEGAPTIDLKLLSPCCEGTGDSGHCVPGSYVPDEVQGLVAQCENGGYCIPDAFIEAGGAVEPVECLSVNGPGVCLSSCIPQVQENYDLLTQDICDVSQRCVPCINPLDGKPTGACDLKLQCNTTPASQCPEGPHVGPPLIDPTQLPACDQCDTGGAHCLPADLVPGDLGSRLADCSAGGKCVPDEFIASAGSFEPQTCRSVGGGEGRCLSRCLPEVAEQLDRLPQDVCPPTHVCVPCTDPLTGEDTGACGLSCDTGPTEPPLVFPKCCDGRGTCIPGELAGDDADSLGEDVCPEDSGLLCAPDEFIDGTFVAEPCVTTGLIGGGEPGACLPDCLGAVDTIFVGRGTCSEGFKCAPCKGPFGGDTGACDFLP